MGDPAANTPSAAAELLAARHGQSLANLRIPAAEAAGQAVTGLPARDADVPLTPLGIREARALGTHLCRPPHSPTTVLISPYTRTRDTYQNAVIQAAQDGLMLPVATVDDRLRDRAQGIFQLLTDATARRRFPQEHARRAQLGPYRHRPPGGESFPEVLARVRALLDDIRYTYSPTPGTRILLVTHDAVILALRALAEGLDPADPEDEHALAAVPMAPTGSLSRWRLDANGTLTLTAYGATEHLAAA
ncbi:hypothetical protein BIV57_18375 [Mangrovactinospora gilvigrisea]|uniref:Histidine phosphatase family protein n=1 Tax=Mangrovactinospora gilvigrisea TaxID=1428644 RepID=A0A1J7BRF5_9ACTN|nr:histidine phosphatase family protein [Mangrovactinospora gilvigrisea]OIV36025.1 hypothetical protein BIV57_18375 [Mangrovactinospora gilvigrisea]